MLIKARFDHGSTGIEFLFFEYGHHQGDVQ
jgi:hypothetical protein